MKIEVSQKINTSRDKLWTAITDFENCTNWISAIQSVEVLERPDAGLLGFKWRETRTMFGKEATETMWITNVDDGRSYTTRAESHGAIYTSGLSIEGDDGDLTLKMSFSGEPQTFSAKIMSAVMSPFFKGATEKAVKQDLIDIKQHIES